MDIFRTNRIADGLDVVNDGVKNNFYVLISPGKF